MATEGHLEKWVNLHEDFGGYEVERKDQICSLLSLRLNVIDTAGVNTGDCGQVLD